MYIDAQTNGFFSRNTRSMDMYVLKAPVEGKGRYSKQFNGKGHFADIILSIVPSATMEVLNHTAIGSVREYFDDICDEINNYIASLPYKSCFKVVITGGLEFPVDSSSLSYRQAARYALRDAIDKALEAKILVLASWLI